MRPPSPRRVRPWSKHTNELVCYVTTGVRPSFQLEIDHRIEDTPRFAGFVPANRDKIRKKLRTVSSEDARLDVRAELMVAARTRRLCAARILELWARAEPGPASKRTPGFVPASSCLAC